jgi:UDP-glucose 4-epimerase
MKLLITGVAGFIGSKLALAAIRNGFEVVGVDDLSNGNLLNVPDKCQFFQFDLANTDAFINLPSDIDVILHLAGQSSGEISFDDPVSDLKRNTISTLNLINYGIRNNIKKIIYASSMSVYGATADYPVDEETPCNPLSCYGTSKLSSEMYLKIYQHQLPYIAFRMFNVYGPGQDLENSRQGMVSIYAASAVKHNKVLVKGSLDRFRDFIYIDDVVKIWLQAVINDKANNQIFNLASGSKTTVTQLLEKMKVFMPTISWYVSESTPGDQFGIHADLTKLHSYFGEYSSTGLSEGLRIFLSWAEKRIKENESPII